MVVSLERHAVHRLRRLRLRRAPVRGFLDDGVSGCGCCCCGGGGDCAVTLSDVSIWLI
jgi:hypothetical protein